MAKLPPFTAYPSLYPDRGAAASAAALRGIGESLAAEGCFPLAVVTPKLHGSNLQARYESSSSKMILGRRNGWLDANESHYGAREAAAALDLETKMGMLFDGLSRAHTNLVAVTVFMEVYGGEYPTMGRVSGKSIYMSDLYRHMDGGSTSSDAASGGAAFSDAASGGATSGGAASSGSDTEAATSKAAAPRRKPVQLGIWYSHDIELAAFDVMLETIEPSESSACTYKQTWLSFDDAAWVCMYVGIPFVPPVMRGTIEEACAWAVHHAEDNALAHYNPRGLPLIPANAGEGFVVRLVREVQRDGVRALVKIKNRKFSEIAHGGGKDKGKGKGKEATLASTAAAEYVTPARAAAVTSKMPEHAVVPSNIKALVEALVADVMEEPALRDDADSAALFATHEGRRALNTVAYAVMRTHLTARDGS